MLDVVKANPKLMLHIVGEAILFFHILVQTFGHHRATMLQLLSLTKRFFIQISTIHDMTYSSQNH
jgi:hypothetical protein